MASETGSIKYECIWERTDPFDIPQLNELDFCRTMLYKKGLIGAYTNGIGYGNISIRLEGNLFLITGTSTGHLPLLTNEHYTKVTGYHFTQNQLTCQGPIKASAESLTHAAVYECSSEVNAVIHIHSKMLWDKLIHQVPTTSVTVEYGTPEMALEIFRLFNESDVKTRKVLVMAGHEEGIITFGRTLQEALSVVLSL
ncbi:MAG TPA: class II aldolase/adducin family protein [Bacteroidales bacterium]